jgi:hypothetical protein
MRSTTVAAAAAVLALTGPACGDAGRPPAGPAPTSTSAVPPPPAPANADRPRSAPASADRPRSAPASDPLLPAVLVAGRQRTRRARPLAWHWLVAGRVQDHRPAAGSRWPAPLRVPPGRALTFRVHQPELPVRVEARTFARDVDPSGRPRSAGRVVPCRRRPGGRCSFARRGGAVEVRLAAGRPRLVVLYCEWFVPPAERPAGTERNPIVSASWGFRLTR